MTHDELELERLTQEVMEYVSRYLARVVNYDEWLREVHYHELKIFIKEVVKNGVITFGNTDSMIAPMYKSFVLGLRIAKGVL